MAVIGEAFVAVKPDPKTTASFGDDVSKGVSSGLKGFAVAAAGIIGGAFALRGLSSALKDVNAQFQESAKIGRLTDAVLASTGQVAGVTSQQVNDLAQSLAAKTGIDDEVIQSGENVLLTFTNIRNEAGKGNDIFNQATTAATNLSAALGSDLQAATIQVGKALNDPIKGVTALSKVGVSFTAQQKDQIKTLVESGQTLQAQGIILKELNTEFGGAAEAAADPLARLTVIVGNFKEALGGALAPAINQIADALSTVLPALGDVLGSAFSAIIPAILPIVSQIAPLLTSLVAGLAPIVQGLGSGIAAAIGPFIAALGPAVQAALPAFNAIGVAIGQIGAALGPVFAAFVPLLTPIVTLVSGLAQVLAAVLVPILNAVSSALTPILAQLSTQLTSALQVVLPVITQVASTLGGALGDALSTLLPALGQLALQILPIVVDLFNQLAPIFTSQAGAIGELLNALLPLVTLIGGAFLDVLSALAPVFGQIEATLSGVLVQAIETLVPIVKQLVTALTPLAPVFGKIAGILADVLAKALETIAPFLGQFVTLMGKELTAVIKKLAPVIPKLADAFLQIATALGDVLISLAPLLPPLLKLFVLLVEKISVPVMIAQAEAFAKIATAVAPIAVAVADILAAGLQTLINLLVDFVTGLQNFDPSVIVDFFNGIAPAVEEGVQAIGRFFLDLGGKLVGFIIDGASNLASALGTWLATIPTQIADRASTLAGFGADLAAGLLGGLATGLSTAAQAVFDLVTGIPDALVALFKKGKDVTTILLSVGVDLLKGIIQGIKNKAGDVLSAMKKFVLDKIPGFVKQFFGIGSPSKMFAGFGANLMEGLAVGIVDATPAVLASVQAAAEQVAKVTIPAPTLAPFVPPSVQSQVAAGGARAPLPSAAQQAAAAAAPVVAVAPVNNPVDTRQLVSALAASVDRLASSDSIGGVHIENLNVPADPSPTQTGWEIARRLRTESFLAGK